MHTGLNYDLGKVGKCLEPTKPRGPSKVSKDLILPFLITKNLQNV